MNQKTIAIAAVIAAALLTGIFSTTPMAAYAGGDYDDDDDHDDDGKDNDRNDNGDYSGTMTEQKMKQSNVGSGGSTNVNCGDQDINSAAPVDLQVCGKLDISALG